MSAFTSSSMSSVVTVMDRLLGNCGLAEEERRCLRRLTPQGIAKLNADLIRGVDPEETMATFRSVFQASQNFRARVFAALPIEVQRVVALEERTRVVSTSELCYLVACRQVGLLQRIVNTETCSCFPKDLDLGECGAIYLAEQLYQKAKVLFMSQSKASAVQDVIACRLAPTTCPDDLSAPHFAMSRFQHVVVYFSPIVTWFHDDDSADPISISAEAASCLSTPKSTITTTSTTTSMSGPGPHGDWSFEILSQDPSCESLDSSTIDNGVGLPSFLPPLRSILQKRSASSGGQRQEQLHRQVHFSPDLPVPSPRQGAAPFRKQKSRKASRVVPVWPVQNPKEPVTITSLLPLPQCNSASLGSNESIHVPSPPPTPPSTAGHGSQSDTPPTPALSTSRRSSKNPLSPSLMSTKPDSSSSAPFSSNSKSSTKCRCKNLSTAVSGWLSRMARAMSA